MTWNQPNGGDAFDVKKYVVSYGFPWKSKNVRLEKAHIFGLTSNKHYVVTVVAFGNDNRKGKPALTERTTRKLRRDFLMHYKL